MDLYYCHECGQPYALDHNGVSYHVDEDGMRDHDADANHIAYGEESVADFSEASGSRRRIG